MNIFQKLTKKYHEAAALEAQALINDRYCAAMERAGKMDGTSYAAHLLAAAAKRATAAELRGDAPKAISGYIYGDSRLD